MGGPKPPLKGGARLAGGVLPFTARRAAIASGSPSPPPSRRGGAEGRGGRAIYLRSRLTYPKPSAFMVQNAEKRCQKRPESLVRSHGVIVGTNQADRKGTFRQ